MKSGFDSAAWKRIEKLAKGASEKAIRGASAELFGQIVTDTPVITGHLRSNWQATLNMPASGIIPEGSAAPSTDAAAKAFNLSDHLYLTNNVEYAERVEQGYPNGQRPHGMVAINVNKFQAMLDKAARRTHK